MQQLLSQIVYVAVVWLGAMSAPAWAQQSSLFHRPLSNFASTSAPQAGAAQSQPALQGGAQGQGIPADVYSMPGAPVQGGPPQGAMLQGFGSGYPGGMAPPRTYQAPLPAKVLRIHDIVQIRVDESARMQADGTAQQRKNAIYDAVLNDWIQLDDLSLKPDVQADGDPRVKGQTNQTYRANSTLQTRESLTFNISAEIADIRPNGRIVLEAHKTISSNDNRWQISLSGECQDSAIGPDNLVLSRDIINLKIDKRESGQARDGYRRGWFSSIFSKIQPF